MRLPCGIPGSVGIGIRIGGIGSAGRSTRPSRFPTRGRPKSARRGTSVLEKLLEEARGHHKKILEMLPLIPPSKEEYTLLLDREEKVSALIKQLINQIAARS